MHVEEGRRGEGSIDMECSCVWKTWRKEGCIVMEV